MVGEKMFLMKAAGKAMEAMEIPPDTSLGCPYLQLYGNRQLKLENTARIIDYDEKRLLLQCRTGRLEISGRHLLIDQYSSEQLTVRGCIDYIRFL